ncbi:MAG: tetratricopeptide repeat protein [Deltaproteobacteria bacterium]|nr:tetratricopeptide repeat protein [Deltaproteobacteria bacterium]
MKFFLFFAVFAFNLPSYANESDYDRLVARANSFIRMGQLQRAIEFAATAVNSNPNRPEAFIVWGRALASQNENQQALLKYEQARSLGSYDRELFVELSSIYDVTKNYDEAIGVYQDWLSNNPHDVELIHQLGLTWLILKKYPEAISNLQNALNLEPNEHNIRQNLGYALLRNREFNKADAQLEQVVKAEPKNVEALHLLAQTKAGLGQLDSALLYLNRALEINPKYSRALKTRARIRLLSKDAKGALNDYQLLLSIHSDDGAILLGAAGALLALNQIKEAAVLIDKVSATSPEHPYVRFRQTQLAIRKGDSKALTTLVKLAEKISDSDEVWQEIAWAAKKFNNKQLIKEAAEHLQPRHLKKP